MPLLCFARAVIKKIKPMCDVFFPTKWLVLFSSVGFVYNP
jgi:hypothetical protein